MRAALFTLTAIGLSAASALAQSPSSPSLATAGDLATACKTPASAGNPKNVALCMTYLAAFKAGYEVSFHDDKTRVPGFCIPLGESWDEGLSKLVPALERSDKVMAQMVRDADSFRATIGYRTGVLPGPITRLIANDEDPHRSIRTSPLARPPAA